MKWILTANKLNIFSEGQSFHLDKEDPLFKKVLGKLNAGHLEKAANMLNMTRKIMNYTNQVFRVSNEQVYLRGKQEPVHPLISEKLIAFSRNGLPYNAIINFTKHLYKNPSEDSRNQLYGFLTKNTHPITEDGMFIAYKHVKRNPNGKLVDVKTGHFINNIGQVVQMKRKDVDPDPHRTCSNGLHVASFEYATRHYPGDILVTVLVNPRHVVAVPNDYNQQKMRVCEYTVIGIENEEIHKLYIPNAMVFKRTREALKKNEGFSFRDMSSAQIVSFVKNIAGERITFNLRSKASIVRKAEAIFTEKKLLPINEDVENLRVLAV
jgi:hypothetical protein